MPRSGAWWWCGLVTFSPRLWGASGVASKQERSAVATVCGKARDRQSKWLAQQETLKSKQRLCTFAVARFFLSQPFQLQSRVNLLRKRSRVVAVMSSSAPHTSTGEKVGQALTRELWAQGLTEHEACGLSKMLPGYEICKILRLEMFFMSSVHL